MIKSHTISTRLDILVTLMLTSFQKLFLWKIKKSGQQGYSIYVQRWRYDCLNIIKIIIVVIQSLELPLHKL